MIQYNVCIVKNIKKTIYGIFYSGLWGGKNPKCSSDFGDTSPDATYFKSKH